MSRPRVMISWAHSDRSWTKSQTSAWKDSVRGFAELLSTSGIDTELDLWADRDTDWTRWGQRMVQTCDIVLIVASHAWKARWEGSNDPREGAGVVVEADTMKGILQNDQKRFQRTFKVVLLPGVEETAVPNDLHRLRRFVLADLTPTAIEPLLRNLTDQPRYEPPPVRPVPDLPPDPFLFVPTGLSGHEGPTRAQDGPPDADEATRLLEAIVAGSASARSVVLPKTIPSMDRLAHLTEKLASPIDRLPSPVVIVGEGGYGKSVLLGQLFDALAAHDDGSTCTVLLPCARVPASADLSSLDALDQALGHALTDSRTSPPLSSVITQLARHRRVRLLIDTLDLVIREENADDASYLLRQLSRSCDLLITCREEEWHDNLEGDGELTGSHYRMPSLGADDIRRWAEAYLATAGIDEAAKRTFLDSLVTGQDGRRVREVCASPLRLAMACEIYARLGGIPENLTVTQLYEEHWHKRVGRDRHGRRGAAATAQEAAAEKLAAEVWASSRTRFVESVTGEALSPDPGAMRKLLSEGVVKRFTGRYAFFHQTYAEFAVARLLAGAGDEQDLARLGKGLRSALQAYWPIARHLLMMTTSDDRYETLAEAVPLDDVEGVRAQLYGAFNRRSSALVAEVTEEVWNISPALLVACVKVLRNSPEECVQESVEVLLRCVRTSDAKDMSRVVETAASLLAPSPPEYRMRTLRRVLDGLISRADELGHECVSSVLARLLALTVRSGGAEADLGPMLVEVYPGLPEAARAEVIRLVAGSPGNGLLDRSLLLTALRFPCPSGAVDNVTTVLLRAWEDPVFRDKAGWRDWRAVLKAVHPERWQTCQVRLVAGLCRNEEVARALLADLAGSEDTARDKYTNAAKAIADADPDLVRQALLGFGDGLTASALSSACSVANHLADGLRAEDRPELVGLFSHYVTADPRRVWPTVIKLCGDDMDLLRARADQLDTVVQAAERGTAGARTVLLSTFDAFLQCLGPAQIAEMHETLLALCATDRARRARLESTAAFRSAEARCWIRRELMDGNAGAASAAARTMAGQLHTAAVTDPDSEAVPWLVSLLDSPHSNVVRVLARGLADNASVLPLRDSYGTDVQEQLVKWATRDSDAQVQSALLDLLVAVERSAGLDRRLAVGVVDLYFDILMDGLGPDAPPKRKEQLPALFPLFGKSFTTLGIKYLSHEELTKRVEDVVTRIDAGKIAGRSVRALASLLVPLARRYPQVLSRLEQLWPRMPAGNRQATAECFFQIERGSPGTRSLALARRPDCPLDTANYIHGKFGG
ncbi:NACHT domain-containing protein [Streptomyces sp. NBC_00414]|uniref:NACHT domain-containing protein n=1 Tax=Streptomyces sp. NBC_00414 TaxID=2975739 RepID=UPI002E24FAE2